MVSIVSEINITWLSTFKFTVSTIYANVISQTVIELAKNVRILAGRRFMDSFYYFMVESV